MKSNIDKKFSAHYDAVEAELKSSTVGEQSACHPALDPDICCFAGSRLTDPYPHDSLPRRTCDPE